MKIHFILESVTQALHFEWGHSGQLLSGMLKRNDIKFL